MENLVLLSLPTALLLLALGSVFEQHCQPLVHMKQHAVVHVANNAAALAANAAGYFAQKHTSALTFKVNGFLRNLMLIAISVFWYRESLGLFQMLGYGTATFGFLWYYRLKGRLSEVKQQ